MEDRDAPIASEGLQNLYLDDLLVLIDRLPDATKEVFVLYAIEGYNHREIGVLRDTELRRITTKKGCIFGSDGEIAIDNGSNDGWKYQILVGEQPLTDGIAIDYVDLKLDIREMIQIIWIGTG